MTLDGKVALVTGAASGIGRAIARRYVAAGGRVAIADLNFEAATAAAKELGDSKTAIAVAMDVSNEDQVNAGVDKTAAAFGTVDILVSNAGIQIVHPIEDFPRSLPTCSQTGAAAITRFAPPYSLPQRHALSAIARHLLWHARPRWRDASRSPHDVASSNAPPELLRTGIVRLSRPHAT